MSPRSPAVSPTAAENENELSPSKRERHHRRKRHTHTHHEGHERTTPSHRTRTKSLTENRFGAGKPPAYGKRRGSESHRSAAASTPLSSPRGYHGKPAEEQTPYRRADRARAVRSMMSRGSSTNMTPTSHSGSPTARSSFDMTSRSELPEHAGDGEPASQLCAGPGDPPVSNRQGGGWLWVSYTLSNNESLTEGATALLQERGEVDERGKAPDRITAEVAQAVVQRVHQMLECPLDSKTIVWANLTRSISIREFKTGLGTLLKTLRAQYQQFRVSANIIVRTKRGHVWDNYDKGTRIGSGAFGDVYIATQRVSGRKYVIKVLRVTNKNPRKDAELIDNFKSEFDITRNLHHLNIVRAFEMFADPYAMVIEFAGGGALFDFISKTEDEGVRTEEWVAGILEQVLGAVSYCHDRGIAHQDLKPDNIL